jgi:CRISPR/Cas system-associated exonuclease Cas4 (RecB family)
MCARRLAREFEGGERSSNPVTRSRMRDAFLAAARAAHAEVRAPLVADFDGVGSDLEPEEQAILAHAGRWYVHVFGDRAVRYEELGLDDPSVSPRRRLRIGGWVDLAVVGADGALELRHLELWGGRSPLDDPLELESVKVAVLRLSGWVVDQPLRVVWVDLLQGLVRERTVHVAGALPEITSWFEARVETVRTRAATPVAEMGADCAICNFVAACPAHPTGAHFSTRKGDLLPGILAITPTSLDAWRRCPREWWNAQVLSLPSSDTDGGAVHGQKMHDVLRLVHQQGTCHDAEHVDDVLVAHGLDGDQRVRSELARHERRCPTGARSVGHEVTRARFHRKPFPPFMASARLDALWHHDDYLAAHDYKTGRRWSERVADDAQARLQAWVLAPLAESLGLRIRIVFEQLSADVAEDPEPFEPDADDLAAIGEELRQAVETMRASAPYTGVSDPEVCGRCRYRSICPDSAVTGVASWPAVEPDADVASS